MSLVVRHLCVVAMTIVIAQPALASEIREITWQDLIPSQSSPVPLPPEGGPQVGSGADADRLSDDEWFDDAPPIPFYSAGVVEDLDGERVKLPGFIVPLELVDGNKISEVLLVPYFGACIHYPPPPPNQIVYVTLPKPVELESMWAPVWIAGEISTEAKQSDLGDAGYTMVAEYMEDYE